jgi:hypothetical protein
MADEAWWGTMLQWVVPSLVMTAVMGWAGRSRFYRQSGQARRLVHPISTLVIGLVCLVLFAGAAVVSNVFPNPTVTWWTTSIFARGSIDSEAFNVLGATAAGHPPSVWR